MFRNLESLDFESIIKSSKKKSENAAQKSEKLEKMPFCITNVPTCLHVEFHLEFHSKMWVVKVEVL